MDIRELFSGIAVIIDDEINDKNSSINNILKQIEDTAMPCVKYDKLPDNSIIKHLRNASFILLDWKLNKDITDEIPDGVKIPESLNTNNDEQNIHFLKELQKQCFCPIFIFTNENVEDIEEKLQKNGLYHKGKCSIFLIKSKSDFVNENSLFTELENWIKETAPIYLLKEWDNAYQDAKSNLFIDFQNSSINCVNVLWKTFKDDFKDRGDTGVSASIELSNMLLKNITSRISYPLLENNVFQSSVSVEKDEIIKVIEKTKFLSNDILDSKRPNTGDLFFFNDAEDYYINIRPQCDLLRCNNPKLYCLKGKELKPVCIGGNCYKHADDNSEHPKEYSFVEGEFIEQKNNSIVSWVHDGKIIEFKFKNLEILKWNDIKDKRVGKLLPPFITHIRQKYATYIEREGLPRMPDGLLDRESINLSGNSK